MKLIQAKMPTYRVIFQAFKLTIPPSITLRKPPACWACQGTGHLSLIREEIICRICSGTGVADEVLEVR
jgi:hypothetical protein